MDVKTVFPIISLQFTDVSFMLNVQPILTNFVEILVCSVLFKVVYLATGGTETDFDAACQGPMQGSYADIMNAISSGKASSKNS